MPTSPDVPWERDELVLVLSLYNSLGKDAPPERVTALSRELKAHLAQRDGQEPEPKVRSTTGVSDKLNAFDALRRKTAEKRGWSRLLNDVWDDFGRDSRRIVDETQQIRARWAEHDPDA